MSRFAPLMGWQYAERIGAISLDLGADATLVWSWLYERAMRRNASGRSEVVPFTGEALSRGCFGTYPDAKPRAHTAVKLLVQDGHIERHATGALMMRSVLRDRP